MALEQYSKRQKILLIILVVVGAALFTVTGTMMVVLEGCGEKGGYTRVAGSLNGQDVTRELFQARAEIMGFGGDIMVPVYPDEALAKTLLINNIIQGDAPSHGRPVWGQAVGHSLFALWPRYHDQHVWLYSILIERAKAAGFKVPATAAASEWYFQRVMPDRSPTEEERLKHFDERRKDPSVLLRAVGELMMVRDYVQSITQRSTVTREQVMAAWAARFPERQARVYRMDASKFEAQAAAELALQEKAAAGVAAATALSGAGAVSPFVSPTQRQLLAPSAGEKVAMDRDQTITFEVISALYEDLAANIPTPPIGELEVFYNNIRGQTFRVTPTDATDARVDERLKLVIDRQREEDRGVEPSQDWKDRRKADLKLFYDFHERRDQIISQLKRSNAENLARIAIESISADMDELRTKARERLSARSATAREANKVPQARLDLLTGAENLFRNLTETPLTRIHSALDTWRDATQNEEAAANGLHSAITDGMTKLLSQSAAMQAEVIRKHINLDQERRAVRDKEIELEDLRALALRNPPADDDHEGAQRVPRAEIAVSAAAAKLNEAERLKPLLDAVADKIAAWMVEVELEVAAARGSKDAASLLRQLARRLTIEYPARIDEWTKDVVSKDRKTSFEEEIAAGTRAAERISRTTDRDSKVISPEVFSNIWKGIDVGRGMKIDLDYTPVSEPVNLKRIAAHPDWFWIDTVNEAKNFLRKSDTPGASASDEPAGAVSKVLHRPGFGYYLIRMRSNIEQTEAAPSESGEVGRKLRISRRARELAQAEMGRLRTLANAQPDPIGYLDGLVAQGVLSSQDTGWFGWMNPVSEVRIAPDPDADSHQGLPENRPFTAFFNALRDIPPGGGVGSVFLEGEFNLLRTRSYEGKYHYSFAAELRRRASTHTPPAFTAGELEGLHAEGALLAPKYAADKDLLSLIDPGLLAEGYRVNYEKGPYEDEEEEKKSPAKGSEAPAKP